MKKKLPTDPVLKSKRVFKNQADKARQAKLEGMDTPFQNALRYAEAQGKETFEYNGKLYAARTLRPVDPVKAKLPKPKLKKPPIPRIPVPKPPQAFPTTPEEPVVVGETRGKYKPPRTRSISNRAVNNRQVRNISPTGTGRGGRTRGKVGKRITN